MEKDLVIDSNNSGSTSGDAPLKSGNSIEQIVYAFCELHYTIDKKNMAVKHQRFEEACNYRAKEIELKDYLNPIYSDWVENNTTSEQTDNLDAKDLEILRLTEIIRKMQNEQNPERSVATEAQSELLAPAPKSTNGGEKKEE